MKEELTVLEVIGLAIRSEEMAAEFYGSLSKLIENELVRMKYENLAREEIGHRRMLAGLYRKMTGDLNEPPKVPANPDLAEGGQIPMAVESLEELLKLAIRREKGANDFYRKAAAHSLDMRAKRTLEYLADIEHGHEMLLHAELEAYLRDRNWYAEKPDVQLVGP